MPLSKRGAYGIMRRRGNRDRRGRWIRNKQAYANGMVKKTYRGRRRRKNYRYQPRYRRRY